VIRRGFPSLCVSYCRVFSTSTVLVQIITFVKIRFSLSLHGLLVYGLQDFVVIFCVWTLLLMERCCAVGRRAIGVTVKLTQYPSAIKWREAKWIGDILLRKCLLQYAI
jgi:hypothetical protein